MNPLPVRFPVHIFASWPYCISGWRVQIFANGPNVRLEEGEEGEEEGEEGEERVRRGKTRGRRRATRKRRRKRRWNPNLIAAATKFPIYVKRSRRRYHLCAF